MAQITVQLREGHRQDRESFGKEFMNRAPGPSGLAVRSECDDIIQVPQSFRKLGPGIADVCGLVVSE